MRIKMEMRRRVSGVTYTGVTSWDDDENPNGTGHSPNLDGAFRMQGR